MKSYEEKAIKELERWQKQFKKNPSITNRISKYIQNKTNSFIPEKFHKVVTETIKNMVKIVLIGSEITTKRPKYNMCLEEREKLVLEKIDFYKKAASATGAGTGAAGFLVGLADMPILITLKIKFLFEVATLYGFDVKDYRERLYILYIFQLAFSSDEMKKTLYKQMENWKNYVETLPMDMSGFDWRTFQQEYRDYIDLAKMLQLLPGIGAMVGAYANYKLMDDLGYTAINAYRLRIFKVK